MAMTVLTALKPRSLLFVYLSIAASLLLWVFAFALSAGNFWLRLTCSASILAAVGILCSRRELKALFQFKMTHIGIGILSALLLYAIFWVGRTVADSLFSFASEQIASLYATKSQLGEVRIGLLLAFVIGPGEEIYWRGFVQRRLVWRFGAMAGVIGTTAAYALIHVASLNPMLILAAAVCGLYWGCIYQREQNLIPVIVSHSLWDILIFVLLPMT
jgi:membrane protease YdiL (CAAX protease family)